MAGIAVEDWLEELRRISQPKGTGLSTREWAAELNMSVAATKEVLRQALEAGVLAVGFQKRPSLDGKMSKVPVYSVLSSAISTK